MGLKPTELKDMEFNWAINPLFRKKQQKRKKRFVMLAHLGLQAKFGQPHLRDGGARRTTADSDPKNAYRIPPRSPRHNRSLMLRLRVRIPNTQEQIK